MERKIVMDTGCLHRLDSDYKALDAIKEGGFKYYDMTLFWKGHTEHIGVGEDYLENAKKLKEYADKIGLKCVQSHATFNDDRTKEGIEKKIEYTLKEMRIAHTLGSSIIIVHPILHFNKEENINYVKNFIPLAHELDIVIAIENIWGLKDDKKVPAISGRDDTFVDFLDSINDDHVKACLDIGHAEMNQCETSAVKMIEALGDRLVALHIHDNDKWCDAHQVPYTQKINFNAILRALKKNNYKGNITFEIETCYNKGEDPDSNLPLSLLPAFIKLEYEIGTYFKKYLDDEIKEII